MGDRRADTGRSRQTHQPGARAGLKVQASRRGHPQMSRALQQAVCSFLKIANAASTDGGARVERQGGSGMWGQESLLKSMASFLVASVSRPCQFHENPVTAFVNLAR